MTSGIVKDDTVDATDASCFFSKVPQRNRTVWEENKESYQHDYFPHL